MSHWWLRPLQATVKGATITLGSTVISCGLAIQVEKHTNRLFFYAAPHWYANVEYAYGITDEQLASVRHLRRNRGGGEASTSSPTSSLDDHAWNPRSSETEGAPMSSSTDFTGDTTKFVRNDATAPKAVVVIPLGDIMSNALTG